MPTGPCPKSTTLGAVPPLHSIALLTPTHPHNTKHRWAARPQQHPQPAPTLRPLSEQGCSGAAILQAVRCLWLLVSSSEAPRQHNPATKSILQPSANVRSICPVGSTNKGCSRVQVSSAAVAWLEPHTSVRSNCPLGSSNKGCRRPLLL